MPDDVIDQQAANGGAGSGGYTPPATQEEFDRIIGARVQRERDKFSDYTDLQAKAARVDELEGKVAEAQAVSAEVPTQVTSALRTHLIALHGIETEDADLFLKATDPETLLKQVDRLVNRSTKSSGPRAPREGATTVPPKTDEAREFTRNLFGHGTES